MSNLTCISFHSLEWNPNPYFRCANMFLAIGRTSAIRSRQLPCHFDQKLSRHHVSGVSLQTVIQPSPTILLHACEGRGSKYGILPPLHPVRNPCIESRSGADCERYYSACKARKCALRHGDRCDSETQQPQIPRPGFWQNN
jgi:hypothetical protein